MFKQRFKCTCCRLKRGNRDNLIFSLLSVNIDHIDRVSGRIVINKVK